MKVLVAVSSKHGATKEIAEWIRDTLIAERHDAVVHDPDEIASLEGYEAVVVASGVYAGHWLESARKFVDRLEPHLRERPVWLVSSGPIGDPPKPEEDPVDVAPLLEATNARGHRIFPGRIDKRLLGFGERAIVMALRVPEGDYRRRAEVEAWAREIAASLHAAAAPAAAGTGALTGS